jgi:hypothetical protein
LREVFEKTPFALSNKGFPAKQLVHKEKTACKSLSNFCRTAQIVPVRNAAFQLVRYGR